MEIRNIKEAKALIKRYRSITLDEIKKAFKGPQQGSFKFDTAKKELTGFGNYVGCTLCDSWLFPNCLSCIYKLDNNCLKGKNMETYDSILCAETPTELRNAYHKRADHIEKLLKEIS